MLSIYKRFLVFTLILVVLGHSTGNAAAQELTPTPSDTPAGPRILTTAELLDMVNLARLQVGHSRVVLDPILMSYSQTVADMAANQIRGQSNGVVADVVAMGYGYPETIETIFCTSSSPKFSLDQDPTQMVGFGSVAERAVNNAFYRHIGFGVAKGVGEWEGYIFYILTACYTADKRYNPSLTITPGQFTPQVVSQVIIPVRTAQPQSNGQLVHEVLSGQSLWAIAMAYNTHVQDILSLNHLPPDFNTIYQGQKLLIPTPRGGFPSPVPPPLDISSPPAIQPSPSPVDTKPPNPPPGIEPNFDQNENKEKTAVNPYIIGVIAAGVLSLIIITFLKHE